MTQNEVRLANLLGKIMMAVGGVGALVTVLFRVWLFPGVINSSNGTLDSPWTVMGFVLVCLVGMAVLGFFMGGIRRELSGGASVSLALCLLIVALILVYSEASAAYAAWQINETMQIIQGVMGVLSAVALGILGFRLLSEGATRRGMAQWLMLVPVIWMWVRLVNYEMSYASLARLEDAFFGFGMLVLELLFLFTFARYIAGVGIVRTGFMMFFCASTALLSLSAAAVSVYFYLVGDGLSVAAHSLTSPADFAVGALALVVGITHLYGTEPIQVEEMELPEEEFAGEDLIMSTDDDSEASTDIITG